MEYHLNFHQTFRPEKDHIVNLLSVANLSTTKDELSQRFGITTGKSSGKVEVSLLYLQAARLLYFKKQSGVFDISRTALGDIVFREDKFLEHSMTQLMIHYFYCSSASLLKLWRLLFVDYRMVTKTIDINSFKEFAERKYSSKNIRTAPLVGTYISDFEQFINIDLLSQDSEGKYYFNPVDIIPVYVSFYAYILLFELETINSTNKDFTLEDLIKIGFHNIFGWDQDDLRKLLIIIEQTGIITLNKQFDNYNIYLNAKSSEIMNDLYL